MEYLGIDLPRPRVAFFDFTGCEGCQLQIANKEETLLSLLSAVEVVNFREISSEKRDDYDIAFIDGAVSRQDEVERLIKIRKTARMVVAIGTCACFGGVNAIRNKFQQRMWLKWSTVIIWSKHYRLKVLKKSLKSISNFPVALSLKPNLKIWWYTFCWVPISVSRSTLFVSNVNRTSTTACSMKEKFAWGR